MKKKVLSIFMAAVICGAIILGFGERRKNALPVILPPVFVSTPANPMPTPTPPKAMPTPEPTLPIKPTPIK